MNTMTDTSTRVTAGVDTHRHHHVVAALDERQHVPALFRYQHETQSEHFNLALRGLAVQDAHLLTVVPFAPPITDRLRRRRRGRSGVSWYLDETYVRVAGRWCYLYRAIDRDGQLVDSMLSEHRDKHAARYFLRRLIDVAGAKPQRVTTDRHSTNLKAIRWILGGKVLYRTNQYLNNLTEQDHRAIKPRYYPMLGFGSFESAARFCTAFDDLWQYFRVRSRRAKHVPLGEQRRLFVERWRSLIADMTTA